VNREEAMNFRVFVTVAAAALISGGAFLADPPRAEAQSGATNSERSKARARSRVTVRKRSYLDAGTDVLPGERKFNDYVYPPGYNALDVLGPGRNFWRNPLNNPWDIPGEPKY
jgi:hypothetical protein